MAANRFHTGAQIINDTMVEVGLDPVVDPYSSTDKAAIQLVRLLNIAGRELVSLHEWQVLTRTHQITTAPGDTGIYDLPSDFAYMINQTGWERRENVPLIGPLSPQDWTYLEGRDLVGSTIYASFRMDQDKFYIFPNDPTPEGLDINFEYVSYNWVNDGDTVPAPGDPPADSDAASKASDIVKYPPLLISRYLKVKWLTAKNFDTTSAMDEFRTAFQSWAGRDTGSVILNAGNKWRGFPYLNLWNNTPDTGYGRVL